MLFNSFEFLTLLLITFILYYLPFFLRYQRYILIIASFVFYSYSQPVLLLLLIFSIIINIGSSYMVAYGTADKRRLYATLGVILNLGILAFFKYSPLLGRSLSFTYSPLFEYDFIGNINSVGEFLIMIPLPIGISFYTFQGISLLVDTFKSDEKPAFAKNVSRDFRQHSANTALFIAFFPQLVAGPIVKAHEFLPQIEAKKFNNIQWDSSMKKIILGYFLKMVIADNMKDHTFWIEWPYFEVQPSIVLLVLLFGYSMQIFADFAGYSLIAIGIAGLFGYYLKDNFNFPYISRSFSEFWRRWHISLSTFLKEYLYIPLGGNRKGNIRTYLNLMVVMFLGGLWHGAAWSYAVWGSFHGIALAVERFFEKRFTIKNTPLVSFGKMIMVFSFVTLAWLLFKLPDFTYALKFMGAVFTNVSMPISSLHQLTILSVMMYAVPVVLYHLHYLYLRYNVTFRRFDYATYGMLVFLTITNSGSANKFIYFQF